MCNYVINEKIPDVISCRRILSIMVITGFMVHHMIRFNISIAIVDMIVKNHTNNTVDEQTRFNWNEEQKNDILGCYFWGYLLTQIPGGHLSEIFGTKIVLGISMLLASILTLLVPVASFLHINCLIAARVCLGLSMGVQWPSILPMANKWVATTDSSKFVSHTIASSLGVAITLPVCGYLIAYLGWPSVFYVTGSITFMWTLGWFYFVYDTPRQHPRISKKEKEHLEKETNEIFIYEKENGKETSLGEIRDHSNEKKPTPWKEILISKPVWAIILTNTLATFSVYIVQNQLPSYMYQVLSFDIKESGLYSSLPYILRYFTAVASCYLTDRIRKINKFSTASIRKCFTSVCCLGSSLLFTLQIFAGPNRITSVIVFTLSLGLNGLGTAGYVTNALDIAPTYCGTVYGLSNAGASLTGYVGTKVVALFTKEKQDFEHWVYIFWILVGTNFAGFLVYVFFASGQIQNWDPKLKEGTKEEKLLAEDTSKSSF